MATGPDQDSVVAPDAAPARTPARAAGASMARITTPSSGARPALPNPTQARRREVIGLGDPGPGVGNGGEATREPCVMWRRPKRQFLVRGGGAGADPPATNSRADWRAGITTGGSFVKRSLDERPRRRLPTRKPRPTLLNRSDGQTGRAMPRTRRPPSYADRCPPRPGGLRRIPVGSDHGPEPCVPPSSWGRPSSCSSPVRRPASTARADSLRQALAEGGLTVTPSQRGTRAAAAAAGVGRRHAAAEVTAGRIVRAQLRVPS